MSPLTPLLTLLYFLLMLVWEAHDRTRRGR